MQDGFRHAVEVGQDIALRDAEGVILATMNVTDKWVPDRAREAFMSTTVMTPRKEGGGVGAVSADERAKLVQRLAV